MNIIIKQAVQQFRERKNEKEEKKILQYIRSHAYYDVALPVNQMIRTIKQKLQNHQQNHIIQQKLRQLSLYLKRETNRLIFQIYEFVLHNPKGVTYKDIEKKTKLEIVNISHYCCRLKKMNFVELKNQKSEKVVKPKQGPVGKIEEDEEIQKPQLRPFFFHQFSMVDNIWVNVSSVDSFQNNGITNEEIKEKLNKHSQTKLIMKLMDQVKTMYNFERQMVSEGKVFEHKYRNTTANITQVMNSGKNQSQLEQKLDLNVDKWLKKLYPQISGQNFLFKLINTNLNSYFSASGVKTARRACTPIKLVRYIKILNSLNRKWPQTHIDLKKQIIEEEKNIPNNGIMHKRSIVGILDGLVEKQILKKEDDYYFPEWKAEGQEIPRRPFDEEVKNLTSAKPRKKVHLSSIQDSNKFERGVSISEKDYQKQLKARLLIQQFETLVRIRMRKAFKRIIYAKRKKTQTTPYEPQLNVLHFLNQSNVKINNFHVDTYDGLLHHLDAIVEEKGVKESSIDIGNDLMKVFKRYPKRYDDQLKNKFGNGWKQKIEPLVKEGCLDICGHEITVREDCDRFFI